MLGSIEGQFEVEGFEDPCLYFDDLVRIVAPLLQERRVDLLVLHGYQQAGLGDVGLIWCQSRPVYFLVLVVKIATQKHGLLFQLVFPDHDAKELHDLDSLPIP